MAMFAVLSVFIVACSEGETESSVESVLVHKERAESYLESSQFRAAVIEARNILQKAPESVAGYEVLARINNEIGLYQGTLETIDNMPESIVPSPTLLVDQASALINVGKSKSAKSIINLLEETGSLSSERERLKARVALLDNNQEEAKKIYETLLVENPENLDLIFEAAEFYLVSGDQERTEELLSSARIIEPQSAKRLYLLGLLEIQQNKLTAAEIHLIEALELHSGDDSMTAPKAAIITQLEVLLRKTGRSVEAMVYREQLEGSAFGQANDDVVERLTRARELYSREEFVASREILEELVAEFPRFSTASVMLATLDFRENRFEEAATRFIEHIDLETSDERLVEMAVVSSLTAEKSSQMLGLFNQSLAVDQDAELLNAYARLLNANGERQQAIESAEKAVARAPDTLKHYVLLATLQQSTVDDDQDATSKALTTIEVALEKNSMDGNAVDDQSLLALSKLYLTTLFSSVSLSENGEPQSDAGSKLVEKAEKFVNKQLDVSKQSASAYELAAGYYALRKDLASAKKNIDMALSKDPNAKTALLSKAVISQQIGEPYKNILDSYEKLVGLEPLSPEHYFRILSSASNQSEFDLAASSVAKLADQYESSTGFAILSRAYIQQGDPDKGDEYYQKAKELAENAEGSKDFERAIVLARANRFVVDNEIEAAKDTIREGLDQHGDSPALLANLIELELGTGNVVGAKGLLPRLQVLEPNAALYFQAELDFAAGKSQEGMAKLERLWDSAKSDSAAHRLYFALQDQEPAKANDFLSQWANEIPDSLLLRRITSSLAIENGDYQKAINDMEFIVEQNPEDALSLNNLAWLYQQKGDDRALQLAERAYSLAPEQADVIDTYAWVLSENGQVEESIPLFEKALSLDPNNKAISDNLKAALEKL